MDLLHTILKNTLIVLAVVMCFNLIIFVHELGHFLAGKWRGLQIDRFQIWFGKPIWKKEIKGVQYGLGWLPFGGFVALPQMAPMESIEGENKHEKPLPPISALDKIIVAFAGPLFSMLLALLAATVVWKVGKPANFVPSQVIGVVEKGSPAEKAGLLRNDKITHINGSPVHGFAGSLEGITENIILSKGKQIEFTVERPGAPAPLKLISEFETEKSRWFQRSGLRQVGIEPEVDHIEVVAPYKGSPAEKAGLKEEDRLVSINGRTFPTNVEVLAYIKENGTKPMEIAVLRPDVLEKDKANAEAPATFKPVTITVTAQVPVKPEGKGPMLGVAFVNMPAQNLSLIKPRPFAQVGDSLRMMWVTITSVISRDSSIGVDHLSGPVGIAKVQYQILQMKDGWRSLLGFLVLFNVNLAVLNMMPFPVLDGGHITLAILEKITGRPVKAKPLEILQTACALALISLMIFVTSKDIGDGIGRGRQEYVFPQG